MTSFATKKTLGHMFFLGPHLLWKVANMQKSNVLKKLYLYFFESDKKNNSFKKPENITPSLFEKRLTWCFQIFDKLVFFNHFWKITQGIVFSTQWIFEHLPPSAINGDPKRTFDPFLIFGKTCRIGKTVVYICSKNITLIECWMLLFMKISQPIMHT